MGAYNWLNNQKYLRLILNGGRSITKVGENQAHIPREKEDKEMEK